MRKFHTILVVLLAIMWFVPVVHAANENLSAVVESATLAKDKNGNDYVRFIIPVSKNMQGIQYDDTIVVMAFGKLAQPAQAYKAGDTLNAIVKSREFQGNTSYTILKFLE